MPNHVIESKHDTPNQRFSYTLVVKEHHLDTFGHVNNATYLQILEDARWDLLHEQGFGMEVIHKTGLGPVVLECQVKFLQELRLRQTITVESSMLALEKKIGHMQQEIFNAQHILCTQATFTFGFFDLNSRKLVMPPPEWLAALGLGKI